MDKQKIDKPDSTIKDVVDQLKKSTDKQHKDFLAGTIINRKELNDLEKGLDRLNKNIEKLTKIISSSSVLEKSRSISSGRSSRSLGSAEVITNPEMGRMLRKDNRPVNVRDLFGNFINKNSKSPDNYFFQSGAQARQREELRIKLEKGEINQEEFDKGNESIGKAGGFKTFFKDFNAGLKDVFNFLTNKNTVQTEEAIKQASEPKEKIDTTDKKKEVNNKIFGSMLSEIVIIRKLLENNFKVSTRNKRQRVEPPKTPGTAIQPYVPMPKNEVRQAILERKPEKPKPLLPNESNIIDVEAKEVSSNEMPAIGVDVDRPTKTPPKPTSPSTGGGSKMKSFLGMAGKAGSALLTGAMAAAGGFAIDYGLGKLGVGKDEEGNDIEINEKQDDENWKKMSFGQKVQSGLARGIEYAGDAFFLGNLSNEARAARIKKETEYLNQQSNVNPNIKAIPKEDLMTPMSEENIRLKEQSNQGTNTTVVNNITQTQSAPAPSAVGVSPTPRPADSSLERYLDRQAVYA